MCAWPHRYLAGTEVDERTALCVLTHDPKFDVPVLSAALRTPAGHIGAMGGRRTHDDRTNRLCECGVTEADLGRIRSPLGLDPGAVTPDETAVFILGEIISTRSGASGRPLREQRGAIHLAAPPPRAILRPVDVAHRSGTRSDLA